MVIMNDKEKEVNNNKTIIERAKMNLNNFNGVVNIYKM